MGKGIARRLLRRGFEIWGYNRTRTSMDELVRVGLNPASSIEGLVAALDHPAVIWIMLPAGEPVELAISSLSRVMKRGDCVIEGGNSYYRDSVERAGQLGKKGIHFVDMGVSGGIWGEKEGYGLMFGATEEALEMILPFVQTLAPGDSAGWVHTGPPGSGHYVKMIHNAIEYGMMQAYAEGLELLRRKQGFELDLASITHAWKDGTVIRSWILDLLAESLEKDDQLNHILPYVSDSGEARWALKEAIDLEVPAQVLSQSLFERFNSRDDEQYSRKILAIIRNSFGGHEVKRDETT